MTVRTWLGTLALLAGLSSATSVLAQPAGSRSTREFITAAGQSDNFERLEAATALAESQDRKVRAFAQMIISDHDRTNRQLSDAATRSGLVPPDDAIGGDQASFLASLQSARGTDFDRLYWQQQLLAHTAALVTATDYATGGDTPAIRDAARTALPMIRAHLATAREMATSTR